MVMVILLLKSFQFSAFWQRDDLCKHESSIQKVLLAYVQTVGTKKIQTYTKILHHGAIWCIMAHNVNPA